MSPTTVVKLTVKQGLHIQFFHDSFLGRRALIQESGCASRYGNAGGRLKNGHSNNSSSSSYFFFFCVPMTMLQIRSPVPLMQLLVVIRSSLEPQSLSGSVAHTGH